MSYYFSGGYDDALRLAGAEVHAYESFGSYQGIWLAKVTYQGKTGWVRGYFGSCSGCDGLQAANTEQDAILVAEEDLATIWTLAELEEYIGPEPYGEDEESLAYARQIEGASSQELRPTHQP